MRPFPHLLFLCVRYFLGCIAKRWRERVRIDSQPSLRLTCVWRAFEDSPNVAADQTYGTDTAVLQFGRRLSTSFLRSICNLLHLFTSHSPEVTCFVSIGCGHTTAVSRWTTSVNRLQSAGASVPRRRGGAPTVWQLSVSSGEVLTL